MRMQQRANGVGYRWYTTFERFGFPFRDINCFLGVRPFPLVHAVVDRKQGFLEVSLLGGRNFSLQQGEVVARDMVFEQVAQMIFVDIRNRAEFTAILGTRILGKVPPALSIFCAFVAASAVECPWDDDTHLVSFPEPAIKRI